MIIMKCAFRNDREAGCHHLVKIAVVDQDLFARNDRPDQSYSFDVTETLKSMRALLMRTADT